MVDVRLDVFVERRVQHIATQIEMRFTKSALSLFAIEQKC